MKILAPLGYILGATTYLVERDDGWVVARIIWPDGSPLGPVPEELDEPVGRLVGEEDILPDKTWASAAVYRVLGWMGLGVLQYQGETHEGRRVWSRVKPWPGVAP